MQLNIFWVPLWINHKGHTLHFQYGSCHIFLCCGTYRTTQYSLNLWKIHANFYMRCEISSLGHTVCNPRFNIVILCQFFNLTTFQCWLVSLVRSNLTRWVLQSSGNGACNSFFYSKLSMRSMRLFLNKAL